jgi:glycosyltransferase involved in cell wall biosynthesis
MRSSSLRVGVAANLLDTSAGDGHGRVWQRVLSRLGDSARIVPIHPSARRPWRAILWRPQVILADGHADLPRARAPLVVEVHDVGWFDPQLRELLSPAFYDHIAPRTEHAIRAADHVITPSESTRGDVISCYGVDPARVHTVPFGVDSGFRPNAPGGRGLVARAREGREAPYVLYAAVLHPRKNLTVLRDAVAGLASEGFPHVLAIVGGPAADRPDSSDLERAAVADLPGAPDRIVRLNRPSDAELAGLMAGADAFCLPSLYEGFGLTVLEAMACGTPVVVSDRGALPEVVADAGLVVPPTAAAVKDALRRVLAEPELAQRLGEAAARHARSFTWNRTASGWLSVLQTAADGPRALEYTRGA